MLRDDVLLLLTEAEGYVSGEEMREKLGVTRAAVSQAVRALRAAGYDIDAVTNRGYCLRARPDTLTAGDVLPYLPQARRALVQCFAQIDSTNSYLKAEAMAGATDGLCAIADRQTAGRGRAGRSFRSDAGQGVYLSMLLRPACAPTAAMTVTAHVAVAVCRALEACGVQPGIKWTNDLVLGTKKLCGILTELTVEAETGTVDSIVAGIGVNVRQRPEDFPPELRTIAGSVRSETGLEISRARLAAEMVRALDQMYLDWQRDPRAYLDDYRVRCVTVGRPVRVVRGEDVRTGFAEAVDDDFALVVRWPDGTRETVTGGDVSVRGLEAARVSALRGHDVTLLEASDALGGALKPAGVPHFKQADRDLVAWYAATLAHLGVDVRLNTRADKALLDSLKPQTVFVAEGSTPRTLALPGADGDNVVSALDVLEGKAKAGKSVVIIGAGLVACELALHLVQNGHTVTLLARRKLLRSAKLPAMNELMLRDLLVFHGVHIVEGAALESVDAKGVYYEVEGVPALAEGDTVITAVGMEANHALFDAIRDDYETVLALGDGRRVRNIFGAIWDGYEAARSL